MKQLLVLSGKGGTGKTTVAGAFIRLAKAKAFADCDVDAPNLHLINAPDFAGQTRDYLGMPKAFIDPEQCIQCDLCRTACRFEAIHYNNDYRVDALSCEGCAVCQLVCPTQAIQMLPAVDGELRLCRSKEVTFSTAKLKMGSGTSGMLVSEVKKQLKNHTQAPFAIIDGSPGIGCPVIASLSGVDLALIVAEPSISGISDMQRIVQTAARLGVKTVVCVNKYDTHLENSKKIEAYCSQEHIPFAGVIPYDEEVIKAVNRAENVVNVNCPAAKALHMVYERTMQMFNSDRTLFKTIY